VGKKPVELRVHGVGGSSRDSLLGVESANETVLVAEGVDAGFYARAADPDVEGYVWGGLTSGSKKQPLWLLLLPFTLVNVAGWTHSPNGWRWYRAAMRGAVMLLGLTLTAAWVLWSAIIVVDVIAYQWGQRVTWMPPPHGRIAIALVLLLGVFLFLGWLARVTVRRFEEVGTAGAKPREGTLRIDPNERLQDRSFFDHPSDVALLLVVHALSALVTLGWVGVLAWRAANDPPAGPLGFKPVIVVIGALQLVALSALVLLSIPGTPFRWAAPAVLCTLAVAINNGFFAGLTIEAANRFDGWLAGDEFAKVVPGPSANLVDVFVATLLVFVVAVVVFAVVRGLVWPGSLWRAKSQDVPLRQSPRGAPLDGVVARRGVDRGRAFANSVRHFDIVLTATAAAFLAFGAIAGAQRTHASDLANVDLDSDEFLFGWKWLTDPGAKVLPYLALAVIGVAALAQRRLSTRRMIGIVWDLFTFWPRRFHPFAVRPYSERAVPELRCRLEQHLGERPVVVSAHSQGSVLAYAAIVSLEASLQQKIAFVTYGSPLAGLYHQAFPAYFPGAGGYGGLAGKLSSWQNFRRLTDPIASKIFERDVVLDDPGVTAGGGAAPPATALEHDREPWVELAVHSYYRNEPVMKRYVAQQRDALAQKNFP
jgi:hypothetical protein